jgi:hypothetical protein
MDLVAQPPPRKPILACMGKEALAAALVFDFGLSQIPSTKYQALPALVASSSNTHTYPVCFIC